MPDDPTPARGKDFVRFRALMYGFEIQQQRQETLSAFESWQRGVEAYEDYLAAYDRRHRPALMDVK